MSIKFSLCLSWNYCLNEIEVVWNSYEKLGRQVLSLFEVDNYIYNNANMPVVYAICM